MPCLATVLVVDPPRDERDVVAEALTAAGFAVRTAGDGVAALRALAEQPADAVVLGDAATPPAAESCRRLRDAGVHVGIVAIVARDDVDDRVEALRAGADDCLTATCAMRELVARVEAVTRRTAGAAPEELVYEDLRLDLAGCTAWRGGRPLELTDTERRLLARLLQRPERVVGRRELLLGVWGYDPGPGSNCLGVYVGYLRRKLELGGEPRLVHTVRGTGYVLRAARTEDFRKTPGSPLTDGGLVSSSRADVLSPTP